MRNLWFKLAAVMLVLAALAGCSSDDSNSSPTPSDKTDQTDQAGKNDPTGQSNIPVNPTMPSNVEISYEAHADMVSIDGWAFIPDDNYAPKIKSGLFKDWPTVADIELEPNDPSMGVQYGAAILKDPKQAASAEGAGTLFEIGFTKADLPESTRVDAGMQEARGKTCRYERRADSERDVSIVLASAIGVPSLGRSGSQPSLAIIIESKPSSGSYHEFQLRSVLRQLCF